MGFVYLVGFVLFLFLVLKIKFGTLCPLDNTLSLSFALAPGVLVGEKFLPAKRVKSGLNFKDLL